MFSLFAFITFFDHIVFVSVVVVDSITIKFVSKLAVVKGLYPFVVCSDEQFQLLYVNPY